jgi:hypothetical protein
MITVLHKIDYSTVKQVLPAVHCDFESAYVIADYPYSFTLRCEKRVWVESNKKGQRLVEVTKNPKTGSWNKPKASTYSELVILYLDQQGYVQSVKAGVYDLSFRSEEIESLEKFIAFFQDGLSPETLKFWLAIIASLKAGKTFFYNGIPIVNYVDKVCTINGSAVTRLV